MEIFAASVMWFFFLPSNLLCRKQDIAIGYKEQQPVRELQAHGTISQRQFWLSIVSQHHICTQLRHTSAQVLPTSHSAAQVTAVTDPYPRQVMALLSVLTPVLAAVLCLVIGVMLVKSRETETTSTSLGKTKGASKADFRPWVDQDLQDDTETTVRADGKSWTKTFVLVPGWTVFTSSMIKCCFRGWENCPTRLDKLKLGKIVTKLDRSNRIN